MRAILPAVVAFLGLATPAGAVVPPPPPPPPPPLLPMPNMMRVEGGDFSLKGASIAASAPAEAAAARRLAELVARSGGARLAIGQAGTIRFRLDPAVAGAEAYRLRVGAAGATVSASTAAGLFYGAETLWQLIASADHGVVHGIAIDDAPAFGWRGVMLDSARHFQPVAYVEQLIDRMAEAKLNVLHWHLTDDQGWRLQIDRYPRLTSVGAWRQPAGAEGHDAAGRPVRYGGFYTKAEVRAVVAYAAERHITIVPEIDVPGHATAIVAAYPALASTPHPPAAPSHDWGVLPNLLNPDDASVTFVENVLDEVMALFPGRYIHLGGDEAVKDQWRANPAIEARMKALGLKNEDALQGWFMGRLGRYLTAHGRTLIGWDEILQGEVPPGAAITSWHGIDGAVAAAKAGHDAVLAPAPILYLDNRQSDAGDEPPGRGEMIDWQRLYSFDPAPAALTPEQRRHILGLQANLWTERVRTTDYADRMIWPRAALLAELGWSSARTRDWFGASRLSLSFRLPYVLARWRALGWHYDETPLAPELLVDGTGAHLKQPAGIGTVRYTVEGTVPTAHSREVSGPIPVTGAMTLAAQAFAGDGAVGPLRRWTVSPASALTRSAAQMQLCDEGVPLRLEDDDATDGVRRVLWADVARPCWIWHDAPLDGVTAIRAEVGRVPFNLADGVRPLRAEFLTPQTAAGELVIRRGCDGPELARLSFAPAAERPGVSAVQGTLPRQTGTADLCVQTAQAGADPLWLLDRLTLETGR